MSRILPTPLLFISGYANTEKVFYCLIEIRNRLNRNKFNLNVGVRQPTFPCFCLFLVFFLVLLCFFVVVIEGRILVINHVTRKIKSPNACGSIEAAAS